MSALGSLCYALAGVLLLFVIAVFAFWTLVAPGLAGVYIGMFFVFAPLLAGVGLWLLGVTLRKAASSDNTESRQANVGKGLLWIGLAAVALVCAWHFWTAVSAFWRGDPHAVSPLWTLAATATSTLIFIIPGLVLVLLGLHLRDGTSSS